MAAAARRRTGRLGSGMSPRDRGRLVVLAYESGLVHPGRLG
ncbi:hypothetical protein AB0C81_02985 [Streptomyces roseoverticillatus]